MAGISDKGWDLGGYLREQREHARLSVRQLANLAGVSNPYLSQVERGLRKPSAEVLQQIARGLRISAEALYVRAGILDSEGRPDVEAAVNADPELSDRQRRVLLDIYASFRAENRRANEDDEPEPVPRRRPAVRVRAAAKTAKSATRSAAGRARSARAGAAGGQQSPAANVNGINGAAPSADSPDVASQEVVAQEAAAQEGAGLASAPKARAATRSARKRATTRASKRTTTRSTTAARKAAAAESDASPTPDGASDVNL